MSSSFIENQPTLLAFGDSNSFKSLFNQIKNQLLTNKLYKNSQNQIEFISSLNDNYSIKINTKYYDIELNVEFISSVLELESSKNHQNLEAIFVFVDKNSSESFQQNKSFERLVENSQNKLNILLSDNQLDKHIRDEFIKKYEDFVDLNINLNKNQEMKVEAEEENDQDEYSDLDELINSIFVHSWSTMNLKDVNNKANSRDSDKKVSENNEENEASSSKEKKLEDIDNDLNELDFENLIMNLKDIRKKADNLSFDERKKYAENIVMNFWKSIGGNEEEIAGLDESDQD
jgi:hypothetical protein